MTPDRVVGPIARALEARGRRFALVGGLAVSLRAEVRFERSHLPRHHRACHTGLLGDGREAAELDHPHKYPHGVEAIHCC